MTEQDSIFSDIEDLKYQQTEKRLRKKMRTAQNTSLVLSIIFALASLTFLNAGRQAPLILMTILLAISIASYKWPVPFLIILAVVYSFTVLGSMVQLAQIRFKQVDIYEIAGAITANLLLIFLAYLIIKGAIATNKYRKLSKQKER